MVQRVKKFNKDCESFRNFNDAIRRNTTRRTYHYILDQLIRFGNFKGYDELVNLDTDKIHDLLKEWVRDYKENSLKYKTIKLKLNVAELFFEMNKKTVYKKILHKMLPDSDEIPAGEFPFTTEEIWLMKKAAKKLRDMAIIDFLASTGVRPGSLSDPVIRMKYVEDMPNGCKSIRVYDGSKEGYWAFLTPEATDSLNRYLASRKRNGEELTEESVLFRNYDNPNKKHEHLSDNSIRQMLDSVMKRAGIERKKTKNRYDKAIIYGFRKRFNGTLKMNNEVNSNIAEKLMAHKRGLDGVYLKPTKEECFREFIKAIPFLTVDPSERLKLKVQKLEQEKSQIDELKEENEKFKLELLRQLEIKLNRQEKNG